jgi:flavin-dependent thymidylate synthase
MQIYLAGYNVDAEVLEELKKNSPERSDVTPETISAAYARISRDPRPINELRKVSRGEVEKARKSNRNIIFAMGHHSVAEHAVFNFDLIGISRLAMEEVEKFRLCSFTEKSQRYITLDMEYLIPDEVKGSKHEKAFTAMVAKQAAFYRKMLENIDKEDARYITPLATLGQVGLTVNSRNLELMFRRFASCPLAEVRELGQKMYALVEKIAPSIILFTQANDLDQKTYSEVAKTAEKIAGELRSKSQTNPTTGKIDEVHLADFSADADDKLVAALLYRVGGLNHSEALGKARKMTKEEKLELVKSANQYLEFYDATVREYEHVTLTYDLVLSAACFGQLKRHRLASLSSQDYDPSLGITLPPTVKEKGADAEFALIAKESAELFEAMKKDLPQAAQYILTNAHRRRVLFTCNARELYHLSRLREDKHAQWDIQHLSAIMAEEARKKMPLTMLLICGKDKYVETFERVYGRKPKILPPKE